MSPFLYASEADLICALRAGHPGAFSRLYDQYAPVLLGVITKIVGNKQRAERLLTDTFTAVHADIEQCPADQPLFLWLFDVARQTAVNALATSPKIDPSAPKLTPTKLVVTRTSPVIPVEHPTDNQQRLLDAVLFDRCTPQEASHAAGLPTENARQHLRQAFSQLRGQSA